MPWRPRNDAYRLIAGARLAPTELMTDNANEEDRSVTTAENATASMRETTEIRRLAALYGWDMAPADIAAHPDRVVWRVMDIGTWDDVLALERVFGRSSLREILARCPAGGMRARSWSFWHYRLGLAAADAGPPAMPLRTFA